MSDRRSVQAAVAASGKGASSCTTSNNTKKPSRASARLAGRLAGPKSFKKAQAHTKQAAALAKRRAKYFEDKSKALQAGISEHGFFLVELPHFLRVGKVTARIASGYVAKDPATVEIFQRDAKKSGTCNVGDGKRRMAVRDDAYQERSRAAACTSKDVLIRRISVFLKELVFKAFGVVVVPSTESLLLSHPAEGGGKSEDQSLHTDGDTTTPEAIAHSKKLSLTNPPSFSVLVSLEGASVSVVHGSHTIARQMSVDPSFMPPPMEAKTVRIPKNHALFFTQDLIHAGDGYGADNLRYHMYFDHVHVPREDDITHPLWMTFGTKRAAQFVRN